MLDDLTGGIGGIMDGVGALQGAGGDMGGIMGGVGSITEAASSLLDSPLGGLLDMVMPGGQEAAGQGLDAAGAGIDLASMLADIAGSIGGEAAEGAGA